MLDMTDSGSDDEDCGLSEECELCGTSIRYVFLIGHAKWEPMSVGTVCCDNLTGTQLATQMHKRCERRDRFAASSRWTRRSASAWISQGGIDVGVLSLGDRYAIKMDGVMGRERFGSEDAAKRRAFDVIENGEAMRFLRARNERINPADVRYT